MIRDTLDGVSLFYCWDGKKNERQGEKTNAVTVVLPSFFVALPAGSVFLLG